MALAARAHSETNQKRGRETLKAKDYIQEYQKQKTIIANCWAEVERWKDIAMSVTAHSEGERVQSAGSKQRMADAVICYSDIEAEIKQQIARSNEIQREIIGTIQRLSEPEYDVLYKTYILEMQFKEIAAKRNKSESWAKSMNGIALAKLQKILDEREQQKEIA